MTSLPIYKAPIVIIGAGLAGLFTALKLAPLPALVLTAGETGSNASSTWAQGGLAAAIGADDTTCLHYTDTMNAGAGLVVDQAARYLTEKGPARLQDLIDMGVIFDHDANGILKLGREAAHSRNRIVHVSGDRAGATIMAHLIDCARKAEHITLKERFVAEDILARDGLCSGVLVHDIVQRTRIVFKADHVILATGGIGGLFAVTTNPVHAQGHGATMALRAGAVMVDPEFTQFHPTALDVGRDPAPLATEALRGAGGLLLDNTGYRFMADLHPDAELAPRDIVARGVAQTIRNNKSVFLDTRAAIGDKFPHLYPTVYKAALAAGLDPVNEPLPIMPAIHYHMGGIGTDHFGETSVNGLWAVGEVASTGVHGANRLASNSLLEALVYGDQCAQKIKQAKTPACSQTLPPLPKDRLALSPEPVSLRDLAPLRTAMSAKCGILRTKDDLASLTEFIAETTSKADLNSGFKSSLLCAQTIAHAALHRTESRGSHARIDFPETSAPTHTLVRLIETELSIQNGPHPASKSISS